MPTLVKRYRIRTQSTAAGQHGPAIQSYQDHQAQRAGDSTEEGHGRSLRLKAGYNLGAESGVAPPPAPNL